MSFSVTQRLRSIDILRGIAMVLMIATHAADAFLADTFKHNDVWYNVHILFGYVAPAYLFLSGVTLYIALLRRGQDVFNSWSATLDILQRAAIIVLVGYWLQIPVFSLRQIIILHRPNELARLFDANILQVIGLTIIAIVVASRVLGSFERVQWVTLIAGVVVALVSPYVWQSNLYLSLPLPIRFYAAPQPAATFGLFPFAAYLLFGFACAAVLIRVSESHPRQLFLTGVGMIVTAIVLTMLLTGIPPYNTLWGPTPQHLFLRIGGLMMVTAVVAYMSARLPVWSTAWFEYAGRKSLAIYVLHLMVIYGSPVNMGIRYWIHGALNGALSLGGTLAATVTVTVVVYQAIQGWEWFSQQYPTVALWLKRAWWIWFWVVFLLKP